MSLQQTFKQTKTKKIAFPLKRNEVIRWCHVTVYSEKYINIRSFFGANK